MLKKNQLQICIEALGKEVWREGRLISVYGKIGNSLSKPMLKKGSVNIIIRQFSLKQKIPWCECIHCLTNKIKGNKSSDNDSVSDVSVRLQCPWAHDKTRET